MTDNPKATFARRVRAARPRDRRYDIREDLVPGLSLRVFPSGVRTFSLTEAKAAGNLTRRLRVLTHPALLVVDEIGYLPVNQDGAVLFFQLINARHEKASTVLTSNKGFEDWGGVLGDEVMAAALIDRLVHHCHIVNIRGNSYRMKDHQNLLQSGSDRRRKRAAG